MFIRLKPIISGDCKGELIVLDQYLSFFGEVDPETGCLRDIAEELCISNKVLVFKGSRGSTVGPYIIYALKKNGKNPLCMIVKDIEPMLVAGCVIAEIPLYVIEDYNEIIKLPIGIYVEVRDNGLYVSTS